MRQEKKGDVSELFYSFFSLIKPRKDTFSKDEWQSHVLPHSTIEELAPDLWHVTGVLPSSTEALADSIHDLQVISVAYGSPIVANCNQRLREAAARLL